LIAPIGAGADQPESYSVENYATIAAVVVGAVLAETGPLGGATVGLEKTAGGHI
jgi:hypothetical protein